MILSPNSSSSFSSLLIFYLSIPSLNFPNFATFSLRFPSFEDKKALVIQANFGLVKSVRSLPHVSCEGSALGGPQKERWQDLGRTSN
jgi:hypothetical protein